MLNVAHKGLTFRDVKMSLKMRLAKCPFLLKRMSVPVSKCRPVSVGFDTLEERRRR